ncbi:MAG: hypothetical protein EA358_08975 [Flavobacteriales bacterium]|nr:MAG: hypothetical protein EA358_08975 [Flavobacteriales bacterium]
MTSLLLVETLHEAEIIAGRLRSEGIQVYLRDQVMNQLHIGTGGIIISVPDRQALTAFQILEELGYKPLDYLYDESVLLVFLKVKSARIPFLRKYTDRTRLVIIFVLLGLLMLMLALVIVSSFG